MTPEFCVDESKIMKQASDLVADNVLGNIDISLKVCVHCSVSGCERKAIAEEIDPHSLDLSDLVVRVVREGKCVRELYQEIHSGDSLI